MAEPKKSKKQAAAAKRGYAITLKKGNLEKGAARAGKGKGTTAQRKSQNIGVADGTIKLGRGGKSYNVYDAKSGTWKRGVVKAATPAKPKAKSEPPNQSQKAPKDKAASKDMRMGYQYPTKYDKPASSYTNQGASVKKTQGGQPKAIRPSGGPVRYARFSGKKK
jgi:hypothetical protein